jgi:hypothetical protein
VKSGASNGRTTSLVVGLVEQLVALDLASADRATLEAALGQAPAVGGWLEAFRVRGARRLEELSESIPLLPEQVLAAAGHVTGREARNTLQKAATLSLVPELEDALAEGQVSAAHVDALSRALNRLEPEQRNELAGHGGQLTAVARAASPEEFERAVKQLANRVAAKSGADAGVERFEQQRRATTLRHWTDRDSGMLCIRGEFDPETGLRLVSRLEEAVEAMFHGGLPATCPTDPERKQGHLRALALVSLVDAAGLPQTDANGEVVPAGSAAGVASGSARSELTVLVDLDTLLGGLHERSILDAGHGAELPVATVRRMACTAGIIPVVLGGDGVPLDVGRERRLATAAQRRALRAMYPTCAIPGCSVKFEHTVPHHLRPWESGGRSDLENLLPLCSRHHHAAHEGGWTLSLDAHTRELMVTLPDGTELFGAPRTAKAA